VNNPVNNYDDAPVKMMLYPAVVFMIVGMFIGLFISINGFLFPDYFAGEYIHFGRVRPVHVGHVLFLWLLSADIGLIYFLVQRLCGVPLWGSKIAKLACVLWWIALIIPVYSYPFGTNTGWEYAEFPMWVGWIPTKPLMVLSWLLLSLVIFMTIARRKYEKMYVSLWYVMGTLIWTTVTLYTGGFVIDYLPGGISRVNANFFYVHNLVGLIFTPMGLATTYYFLPKLAKVPIYSHRLSMVGFWSIAFVYAWIGTHHMIHGPVSQWLQTTAIIFSIWLFIPVWTVVTNFFGTVKDSWKQYSTSVPIRFLMMGTLFYLVTCIQGPLMALRNVNEITSKTDWIIGHSHISLYGCFTFFAFAGIYHVLPIITKKPMWSQGLTNWHCSLNMLGSILFILPLWIGGFLQGMEWSTWATGSNFSQFHHNLSVLPFLKTIDNMRPWWIMRSWGGLLVLIANVLFVVNVFNTIVLKPRIQPNQEPSVAS
jgi:cytochrome c oxidase cbb3-type subunit 1